jgi:hypothetical protein
VTLAYDPPPFTDDQPPPPDQEVPAPPVTIAPTNSRPRPRPTPRNHDDRSNDPDAERQVLGAALTSPAALDDLTQTVTGRDFYDPWHETIWHAITHLHDDGRPVDVITVHDHLVATGQTRTGDAPRLFELVSGLITAANADAHAQILREHTLRRAYQQAVTRVTVDTNPADIVGAVTRLTLEATELRQLLARQGDDQEPIALDLDDFLHADDSDEPDWLIPAFLERGDRLILTAGEGHGKSTLLRQLAVQAAAGIHPFTGDPMPPVRVLLVDLENSERQTRRKLRPLRVRAGGHLTAGHMAVTCRIDGLDLANDTDLAWLDRAITQTAAQLLVVGPIYKMATGNPNDEKEAKPIAMAIDHLRARHGTAVILEAHSAKTPAGVNPKNRPKEPVGWSGWMRWPEFGLHLAEDGTLTHWRGMRDGDTRDIPTSLHRGGPWPWSPQNGATSDEGHRWIQIHNAIVEAGRRLSVRELEDATGIPRSTVSDLQARHRSDLQRLYDQIEE